MANRTTSRGWCTCWHGFQYHRNGPCSLTRCYCDSFDGRGPQLEHLLAKTVTDDNGCMLFQGAKDTNGYGQIAYRGERVRCHRLSFQLSRGFEASNNVLHSCDVPSCINPAHLRDGTQTENIHDMLQRGRHVSGFVVHRERFTPKGNR